MDIRCPQANRIEQHLIHKAHNRRIVIPIIIRPLRRIGVFIHRFHIQIIQMHIIHSAQSLAYITVTGAFLPLFQCFTDIRIECQNRLHCHTGLKLNLGNGMLISRICNGQKQALAPHHQGNRLMLFQQLAVHHIVGKIVRVVFVEGVEGNTKFF